VLFLFNLSKNKTKSTNFFSRTYLLLPDKKRSFHCIFFLLQKNTITVITLISYVTHPIPRELREDEVVFRSEDPEFVPIPQEYK
jgi:hypothetical protein